MCNLPIKRVAISIFLLGLLCCFGLPAQLRASEAPPKVEFPSNVPKPLKIGVAIILNNINKINETTSNYEAIVDVRLRWRDPDLAFDTTEVGADRLEFGNEEATAKLN